MIVKEAPSIDLASEAPQETFVLNLGPQHPATHGVLRVKLTMDGEFITRAEPVCGYIHRMQEKMGENRTYAQFLPNTSRIDYLSAMTYTHAFVGAIERAAKLQVPPRAEYIRVITSELNRISSHLVWWGAFLLDLGGFTPLLYAFDDRERILDLLESICGARLTYAYYRIGGLYNDVDDAFLEGTRAFVAHMRPRLKMYRELVTENIILRKRLIGIGPLSQQMCRKYGASGPVMRGSGIRYDVRKAEPYSVYSEFDFEIPFLPEGDSMARYLVRMEEIAQSLRIIESVTPASNQQIMPALQPASTTPLAHASRSTRSKPPVEDSWSALSATTRRFLIASNCAPPVSQTSASSKKPARACCCPMLWL